MHEHMIDGQAAHTACHMGVCLCGTARHGKSVRDHVFWHCLSFAVEVSGIAAARATSSC
jgi:hypothetical protein